MNRNFNTAKLYVLIVSVSMFTIPMPGRAGTSEKPAAWGYLLHTSNVSKHELQKIFNRFDVICMTGFKLAGTGEIISERTALARQVIAESAQGRFRVYPLISFKSTAQGGNVLRSSHIRKKAAGNIAALSRLHGFSGVHLDFEYLPPSDSQNLAEFIMELRKAFSGKITMAVFPQVNFPEKWSRFHNLEIIAPCLDEIVLMCYDLHGTHTGPGPVTDVSWAEKNIRYALKYKRPGSVWLGVPAYGYRWCGDKVTVVSARSAAAQAKQYKSRRDDSGNLELFYQKENSNCTVYIADARTRLLLTRLAIKYNLAGTALWRLGLED